MTDTTPEAVAGMAEKLVNTDDNWHDAHCQEAAAMLTALSAKHQAELQRSDRWKATASGEAEAFRDMQASWEKACAERDQALADLAEADKLWDLVNRSYDITGSLEAGCEHGFRPAATCPNADCESGNIHRAFLAKHT